MACCGGEKFEAEGCRQARVLFLAEAVSAIESAVTYDGKGFGELVKNSYHGALPRCGFVASEQR